MPRIVREAEIDWEGTTARGSGVVRAVSTGSFDLSATIASRVEVVQGKTSPEELLAAAHATCYVTSLGSELARLDGVLQLLGDLVVHGHRAVSIHGDRRRRERHAPSPRMVRAP